MLISHFRKHIVMTTPRITTRSLLSGHFCRLKHSKADFKMRFKRFTEEHKAPRTFTSNESCTWVILLLLLLLLLCSSKSLPEMLLSLLCTTYKESSKIQGSVRCIPTHQVRILVDRNDPVQKRCKSCYYLQVAHHFPEGERRSGLNSSVKDVRSAECHQIAGL